MCLRAFGDVGKGDRRIYEHFGRPKVNHDTIEQEFKMLLLKALLRTYK